MAGSNRTSHSAPRTSCSSEWERAYLDFETPSEARAKIARRLRRFGADAWSRDARILEIFCGAGHGLEALTRLGFQSVEGMDLSADLLARYQGPAPCHVGDCRQLPFDAGTRDVVIVHGGLHHLETLEDVGLVLAEAGRVLCSDGLFCAVEPWPTPFLACVRTLARNPLARRTWRKLDAFQTMVEHELETYERWLSSPQRIEQLFVESFHPNLLVKRWGSLVFSGKPRKSP